MNIPYNMVVDFARPTKSNTIIISEGDTNSRVCHFTLLANKSPMDMIDVTSATVRGVKQDGSVIFGDATILEDDEGNKLNEVEYTIPAAITDEAGNVTMTITLMSSASEQVTSFEFYLKVRNALYNEDDLVSQSDLAGFRDLLNRCLVAVQKIEQMTESETLPNPFPLSLLIEGIETVYTGASSKQIILENMAYIGGEYDPDESIDESAAHAAAESANEAETSATIASSAAIEASSSESVCTDKATEARDAALTAINNAGMAEGYATQARETINKLSLPTTAGTYKLKVTANAGVIAYSWVSA